MAATARIVESVGVSAYLGGAALLSDPVLLTSAASILTVEARHQTILNILSGIGTAIPNAFDFALTPSEVLALASPFFNGPCDVGVPGNVTREWISHKAHLSFYCDTSQPPAVHYNRRIDWSRDSA
jgi:ferritin-like protein